MKTLVSHFVLGRLVSLVISPFHKEWFHCFFRASPVTEKEKCKNSLQTSFVLYVQYVYEKVHSRNISVVINNSYRF